MLIDIVNMSVPVLGIIEFMRIALHARKIMPLQVNIKIIRSSITFNDTVDSMYMYCILFDIVYHTYYLQLTQTPAPVG